MRTSVLAFIAIAFMWCDHRYTTFHHFRVQAQVSVVPLQYMVDLPIKFVHWAGSNVAAQRHLLEDNARLRARELLLESKLQKLLSLEQENAQLRQLLQSTPQIAGKVVVAQLLAVDLDPSLQQVVLDKGSHAEVYQGQPVLDAYGVVGQVVDVGKLTSKVLLLTDSHSAIPVQNYRNGIRAIAVGTGRSAQLEVNNISGTSDVKKGDLFVTSGLGLRFPVGYPVGVVDKVALVAGKRFAEISLLPAAHLDRTQQVLLVWPEQLALKKAARDQLAKPLPNAEQEKD